MLSSLFGEFMVIPSWYHGVCGDSWVGISSVSLWRYNWAVAARYLCWLMISWGLKIYPIYCGFQYSNREMSINQPVFHGMRFRDFEHCSIGSMEGSLLRRFMRVQQEDCEIRPAFYEQKMWSDLRISFDMENCPFIDDFPTKTMSKGFSIAT